MIESEPDTILTQLITAANAPFFWNIEHTTLTSGSKVIMT